MQFSAVLASVLSVYARHAATTANALFTAPHRCHVHCHTKSTIYIHGNILPISPAREANMPICMLR